ncbi:MAG: hypothetical protein MZU97_07120 [Bacillus subtilis]|nr:hypothetical protein [Bacillus subtilis]
MSTASETRTTGSIPGMFRSSWRRSCSAVAGVAGGRPDLQVERGRVCEDA